MANWKSPKKKATRSVWRPVSRAAPQDMPMDTAKAVHGQGHGHSEDDEKIHIGCLDKEGYYITTRRRARIRRPPSGISGRSVYGRRAGLML